MDRSLLEAFGQRVRVGIVGGGTDSVNPSPMKTEQQSPAADTESTRQIVFSVNILVPVGGFEGSRFIKAGEPSPYRDVSEVPEQLKVFVAPAEPLETAESDERFANFQLNTAYLSNSDGSRGRALRRQAGELAASASLQEQAEAIASAAPDEALASAMKIVQEQHDVSVALQIKELEIRERDAAAAVTAAGREAEEEEAARESGRTAAVPCAIPVEEEEPAPKPRERRRK